MVHDKTPMAEMLDGHTKGTDELGWLSASVCGQKLNGNGGVCRRPMEFTGPVRAGDRITATGIIEELDQRGILTVRLQCTNQRDEVVVRGTAILKKLKEVYEPSKASNLGISPTPYGEIRH